jgi:TonB family protein
MNTWLNVALAAVVVALISPPADESLASARALYAAAEYEESFGLLDKQQATPAKKVEEARGIEQYRAYCLLALGRGADAERAIAAMVSTDPLYRPTSSDVSPRVQTVFRDVRVRMLPAIIQSRYAEAKARFDAKQFGDAARLFAQVIDAMNDPDMAPLAAQSPLADLKTLAGGFKELSVQAIPPPVIPATPAPVAAPATTPAATAVVAVVAPRIFASDDPKVAPPIPLHQSLPAFPAQISSLGKNNGVLEVVVDESGKVESAAMRVSVNPKYDQMVLDAVKKWRFEPATRDGGPVKYRKMMQVAVK